MIQESYPVHVVTKVLVVFAAVLCVVLSALSISLAANVERVRGSMEGEMKLRQTAQSELEVARNQHAQEIAALQEQLRIQTDKASELQQAADNALAQWTELKAQVNRAQVEVESSRTRNDQLAATVQTQADVIQAYRDEVTGLRTSMTEGAKREVDLFDRINDLEASREVLEQTARTLREQLTEARNQLQSALSGQTASAGTPGQSQPVENLGPLVRARVLNVFKGPDGSDMIEISEGANRGVKENTFMHLVRDGSQYVGKAVVTRVEPQRSICRVTLYANGVNTAKTTDEVRSQIQ